MFSVSYLASCTDSFILDATSYWRTLPFANNWWLFSANPKPRLQEIDRLFWVIARRLWSKWKQALMYVTPETVARWHRAGFPFSQKRIHPFNFMPVRRKNSLSSETP